MGGGAVSLLLLSEDSDCFVLSGDFSNRGSEWGWHGDQTNGENFFVVVGVIVVVMLSLLIQKRRFRKWDASRHRRHHHRMRETPPHCYRKYSSSSKIPMPIDGSCRSVQPSTFRYRPFVVVTT